MNKLLLPLSSLGVLALAACASDDGAGDETNVQPPSDYSRTSYFVCERGPSLRVDYGGDTITVTPDGGTAMELSVEPMGSGYAYTNGRYSLRQDNAGEVTWTAGRSAPTTCTESPRER